MAKRIKIGITDKISPPYDLEQSAFKNSRIDVEFVELNMVEDARSKLRDDFDITLLHDLDALIVWHVRIDDYIAENLKNCKLVVRHGVGYDKVDVPSLTKRQIPFCNNPDYGTEEVADSACAMIMALQRKIFEYNSKAKDITSGWQAHTLPPIMRTQKTTLGIIGTGRIGTAVINRMKAFRFADIIGYDPYKSAGYEKSIGFTRVHSLEELLQKSNIISLHCPLNDETKGMIDEHFISQMPDNSYLINNARGGLIKDMDIIENALKTNKLAGVGLDVLPQEPPEDTGLIAEWKNDAEWLKGRVIINNHTAFFSGGAEKTEHRNESSIREIRYLPAETIRLFFETGRIRNQITE
jgi:D-3-phosphoglycerate dehydrogenase